MSRNRNDYYKYIYSDINPPKHWTPYWEIDGGYCRYWINLATRTIYYYSRDTLRWHVSTLQLTNEEYFMHEIMTGKFVP